jgi:predicted N-acetyltransferase YhbS
MNAISLRLMRAGDLEASDNLRRLVGWNQTLQDWHRMLQLEPQGCFVALAGAEVVGTVTTLTYGQALAWIGMMLVHPKHRRQGIATRLMIRALDYLKAKEMECIRLDATPAGQPLYEQLGFFSEWTLTRWQRPTQSAPVVGTPEHLDIRKLAPKDWPAVLALDTAAFGVTRSHLLHSLASDSRVALVWPAVGHVLGWGLLRRGANADYLGPLTCSSPDGASTLAAGLLHDVQDRSVFWDSPDRNLPANAAAKCLGFVPVRPLTRMRFGRNSINDVPFAQFAIADPAVG